MSLFVSRTLSQTCIHQQLHHIPGWLSRHSKHGVPRTKASSFSYAPLCPPPLTLCLLLGPSSPAACDLYPPPSPLSSPHPRGSPTPLPLSSSSSGPQLPPPDPGTFSLTSLTSLSFWVRLLTGPQLSHVNPTICLQPSSPNPPHPAGYLPAHPDLMHHLFREVPVMPRLAQVPSGLFWKHCFILHQDMSTLICFMICLAPRLST